VRISSSFSIPAPPHEVFDRFLDPETMKSCIPGCDELERLDESHYRGQLVNEVAHVRFNARFAAEIVEMDRPRLVRAVLNGEDRRLGSSLKLTASLGVEPDGDSDSAVSYEMDLALWGKLGRLGEPIIRRRSAEVERDFVTAFKTAFTPETEPAVIGVSAETPSAFSPSASAGQRAAARARTGGRRVLLVVLQKLRVRMDRWIEALG
jgi:carbon monoxide dehydrogenase subunit G